MAGTPSSTSTRQGGDLHRVRRLTAGLLLLAAGAAAAQGSGPRYSFEAARERAVESSNGLSAARAGAEASRNTAEATSSINLPILSLDAQAFRYQKTIDISLRNARDAVIGSVNGLLAHLPVPLSSGSVFGANAAMAQLPGSLKVGVTQNVWRPTLTLLWPIYTGGLSTAAHEAAKAGARQAEAELLQAQDALDLSLVAAYFGQQLAAQLVETSRQNLERFELHYQNALKMEHQGVLSKAERLQLEVARNAAQRQLLRATNDHDTAAAVLTRLLNESGTVQPQTPLFALSAPIEPMQQFVAAGKERSPLLMRLQALHDASRSGVQAAQAQLLPKVYGFGSYNMNPRNAVLPDPDWIVGIGVHYTLFSNIDRQSTQAAARAREQQARSAIDQAGSDVETLIVRSYHGLETSRKEFMLLSTNMVAAEENVRVHAIGFREGQLSSASLIDAQVALSMAQTQRAAAAYEYDIGLAQLLAASGQMQQFQQYLARADQRVTPP